MANTLVEFTYYDDRAAGIEVVLTARTGATGTPAASYAAVEVDAGLYRVTVPQALVGDFNLKVYYNDELALRQYVNLVDDTAVHIASDQLDTAQLTAIQEELDRVLKSGEEFVATSINDDPKNVTFTRVE